VFGWRWTTRDFDTSAYGGKPNQFNNWMRGWLFHVDTSSVNTRQNICQLRPKYQQAKPIEGSVHTINIK
jgi:hypothetical protein